MALFGIIDALLIGAHYLAWGLSVLGIPVAVILLVANVSSGIWSMVVAAALLLLAVALSVLIMPELVSGKLAAWFPELRSLFVPALACCALACILAGAAYFIGGGFPEMNLLFK